MRNYLFVPILVCLLSCLGVALLVDSGKQKQINCAYDNGAKSSIGRPMKYADLPDGHYTVLAVVSGQEEVSGRAMHFAVVGQDSHQMTKNLIFVQDMPSSMLIVSYTFSNGWTTE
jgi:hypothetical protein